MTVLVAFASKHGSTDEIARFVADRLGERGVEARRRWCRTRSSRSSWAEKLRPRDHRLFFGVLDRDKLRFGERMMVKAVKAPEGDFRNWDEMGAWADGFATELMTSGG